MATAARSNGPSGVWTRLYDEQGRLLAPWERLAREKLAKPIHIVEGGEHRQESVANALAAFPAEGIASLPTPNFLAIVTAHASPRALKESVGLWASSLIHKFFAPSSDSSLVARISGVHPSSRVMASLASAGSTGEYRHMLFAPAFKSFFRQAAPMVLKSYSTRRGHQHSHRFQSRFGSNVLLQRLQTSAAALPMFDHGSAPPRTGNVRGRTLMAHPFYR